MEIHLFIPKSIYYNSRCSPLHPLCGALIVSYVKVRVTHRTSIAYRNTYAPPRCRTTAYLFFSQCISGIISLTLYLMVRDWWVFRVGTIHFYWSKLLVHFKSSSVYLSLLSLNGLVLWGWGNRTYRVPISLSSGHELRTFVNNNNIIYFNTVSYSYRKIFMLRLVYCTFHICSSLHNILLWFVIASLKWLLEGSA